MTDVCLRKGLQHDFEGQLYQKILHWPSPGFPGIHIASHLSVFATFSERVLLLIVSTLDISTQTSWMIDWWEKSNYPYQKDWKEIDYWNMRAQTYSNGFRHGYEKGLADGIRRATSLKRDKCHIKDQGEHS